MFPHQEPTEPQFHLNVLSLRVVKTAVAAFIHTEHTWPGQRQYTTKML